MTKAELLELLQDLDDDAEITVVDNEQEFAWDIIEVRTTDGDSSYADIVIDK